MLDGLSHGPKADKLAWPNTTVGHRWALCSVYLLLPRQKTVWKFPNVPFHKTNIIILFLPILQYPKFSFSNLYQRRIEVDTK